MVPKFPAVARFEVLVDGVTVTAGPELRSTIGGELATTVMVLVSVSVNAPPPILPPSLVTIVKITVPTAPDV